MLVKTKAIVISAIKFQEKSLIVKCFTESDGLKTYFVQNVFSNRKSNQKIGYFQPLTILEIEALHKNKGTLENIKEVKISYPFSTINTNIYKSTIVIFISEIFNSCIQEEEKNESLFSFLENALIWLDNHNEVSNFHLILLLESTKFLGFYPDLSNSHLPFFDLNDGVFRATHTVNSLTEEQTFIFKKLIDLKFDSNQKIFTSANRQVLLKILLKFYAIHLSEFRNPKSLEVLNEVFK